jgi:Terminase large subunit, T4likevirus-type, N-terminal
MAMNNSPPPSMLSDLAVSLSPVKMAEKLGFQLDDWQKSLMLSTSKRICANCGRQTGKTQAAILLVLWTSLTQPNSTSLLLAPSLRQSGESFKRIIGHYKALGRPVKASSETALTLWLENGSRIIALPSTFETIRGYAKVDLLVLDEAAWISADVYRSVRPFLAVSDGKLVMLSTAHGKRGIFWDAWNDEEEDWLKFHVKTADCPRVSAAFLRSEKNALGPDWYSSEYDAAFTENEFSIFPHELVMSAIDSTGTLKAYDFDLDDDVAPFTGKYEGDEDDEEDGEKTAGPFQVRYHDEKSIQLEGEEDE